MPQFTHSLRSWNTADFKQALIADITNLDAEQLPLQQALSKSSYVSESDFSVTVLSTSDNSSDIVAKVGIFFTGIIAGSCCSDDPTPVDELEEYCELYIRINK